MDPFDRRPIPHRRRRRGVARLARMLAWTAGAVLLMVVGGIVAVTTWPRSHAPGVPVAPPATDVAAAPTDAMAREVAGDDAGPTTGAVTVRDGSGGGARAGAGEAAISPPPLPALPPSLESATSAEASAAKGPDAARERQPGGDVSSSSKPQGAGPVTPSTPSRAARDAPAARAPVEPSTPRPDQGAAPAPAPPDTRTSAEIMADFLVSSSGRAQAESTAREYSEWYEAGSRERAYWIQVLATIRGRP